MVKKPTSDKGPKGLGLRKFFSPLRRAGNLQDTKFGDAKSFHINTDLMVNLDKNNLLSVLFRPQFLVFSFSVIFSQIATNMLNIVLILLTYKLTNSSFAVSILIITFLLPQVALSFMGGIIADAKNKRRILLFGNLGRVLVLLLLYFAKESLAMIYIFQLAISIITQFYIPAETPLIPYLVRKNQLLAANAVFGVCLFGSILVGYVIAGPSINLFGESGVFIFMAFLFFLAYLCILMMPKIKTKTEKIRTEETLIKNIIHIFKLVITEFKICIHVLRSKPVVFSAVTFLALSQVIILIIATLIPDYAEKVIGIHPEDISLVIFAPAALGMISASVFIGSFFARKKNEERIIDFGIFLSVIVLFLFSTIDIYKNINIVAETVIISFMAGVANACIFIPAQTLIQVFVEEKYLSKIYGLLFAVVGVMALLPIILAGAFADVLGVKVNLFGISILLFAIGLFRLFILNSKK